MAVAEVGHTAPAVLGNHVHLMAHQEAVVGVVGYSPSPVGIAADCTIVDRVARIGRVQALEINSSTDLEVGTEMVSSSIVVVRQKGMAVVAGQYRSCLSMPGMVVLPSSRWREA